MAANLTTAMGAGRPKVLLRHWLQMSVFQFTWHYYILMSLKKVSEYGGLLMIKPNVLAFARSSTIDDLRDEGPRLYSKVRQWHIYTVSPKKNILDIIDSNLKQDYHILIIFGTNISDTTVHQTTVPVLDHLIHRLLLYYLGMFLRHCRI